MGFIETIKTRARADKKTIVLPETQRIEERMKRWRKFSRRELQM